MSILYILDHFAPYIGGTETLFDLITQHELKQGNQVIVLTNKHDSTMPSYEIINQVVIYRVGGPSRQNRIAMCSTGHQLIKQYNIKLIHTSTYSAALPARILSNYHQIPNQIHIHEVFGKLWHNFLGYKAYLNQRFEKLVIGLLPRDRYLCVSRYALNSVRTHFNLPDHKLYLEPNPINTQFWKPYSEAQAQEIKAKKIKILQQLGTINDEPGPIGLYYGRTGRGKGLQLYIEALPQIINKIPNFHAVIIAPTHEPAPNRWSQKQTSHTIKQLIKQLNLTQHISRVAPVSSHQDIKDRITASDIVILPSLTEGFGYAMHEVAYLHKPLVTTQIGGAIETLSTYDNTNEVGGKIKFSSIYRMKQVTSKEVVSGVTTLL